MRKLIILIIFFLSTNLNARLKIPSNHKPLTINCEAKGFDNNKFNLEKTVTIKADDDHKNGHAFIGSFKNWEFWVTFNERLFSKEFTEV